MTSSPAPEQLDFFAELCGKKLDLDDRYETVKTDKERVDAKLLEAFEERNDDELVLDGYILRRKRVRRMNWDTDILRALMKAEGFERLDELPSYVKLSLSIKKADFEKLDPEVQDELRAAFEWSESVSIKVETT